MHIPTACNSRHLFVPYNMYVVNKPLTIACNSRHLFVPYNPIIISKGFASTCNSRHLFVPYNQVCRKIFYYIYSPISYYFCTFLIFLNNIFSIFIMYCLSFLQDLSILKLRDPICSFFTSLLSVHDLAILHGLHSCLSNPFQISLFQS